MPPPTYSALQPLLDHITSNMTPNANQENTGARTQQLLQTIALSLVAIIGAVPAPAGSIQPWDTGLEYDDQVIVSHGGRLWLYVKSGANSGTEPGTDETVWVALAMLGSNDGGGGAASTWLAPCDMGPLQAPPSFPTEGLRALLGNSCSGAFTGHDNEIATYSGGSWSYYSPQHCDVTAIEDRLYQYTATTETWKPRLRLADLLAIDNKTEYSDIEVTEPTAIAFRNNGHLMRLIGQDIADDHEVVMPEEGGTLATTQAVVALQALQTLAAVLVNGNETLGRSVQISENDGVNWLQGANMVRVKAPAAITALRTLLWPDKSGTVATTDDVAAASAGMEPAIEAGSAGQYWRGDKTWQTLDKVAVGLANVDDTADADKPVSTAQAAAIAAAIDALVTGAPGALDTLNELAAALGDDPNFASTVTGLVAAKEDAIAAGTTAQYYRGDKTWQSLASAVAATPAVTANTAKVSNASHTGDVTGATALTIGANKVTNAKAAKMAANTIKGNNTGSTANQEDLTVAQTKTMLALENVDNTADADKPVSTAQAAALALKAPLASPAFTGTPTAPTATPATNNTQVATTAYADAAVAAEVTNRAAAISTAVAGRDNYRGTYDASTNLFPSAGGSGSGGAVMKSDYWTIGVAGTLDGDDVNIGDEVKALSDGPGQTGSLWYIDAVRQTATTTEAENRATTDNVSVLTPVAGWALADKALSASPLTGLVDTTATPALATDTPVVAIGKAQGQINAITGTLWARMVLNQTGTGAPTITGKVGSMGTVTAARTATGEYALTLSGGGFTANKTHVTISPGLSAPLGQVRAGRATGTVIGVKTWNSGGTAADDMLVDTTIEIHVAP